MNIINFLKEDKIALNGKIYKPYNISELANIKFGEVDKDGFSFITDWFNYKGYTYIAE